MPEPIFEPDFWSRRLRVAISREQIHHAVYICDPDTWRRIAERHRRLLAGHIAPTDDVLDVGCGWGRLLSLLPYEWRGHYTGVDLSPDFIRVAREAYPELEFVLGDIRNVFEGARTPRWDWAVLVSIRDMITDNLGAEHWNAIREVLLTRCDKLLILEYTENDEGVVLP